MEKARIGQNGFTLIELMITIVLAAVVLTLGVPSYRALSLENRMVSELNELTADLALARSEAIKRGASVTVCRRDVNGDGTDDVMNNGDQCAATAGPDVPWDSGWIVFTDTNQNSRLDTADADTVLRVRGDLSDSSSLEFGRDRIRYDARGFSAGFNGTFTFCDSRGNGDARGRILSNTGRLRALDSADLGGSPCT